MGWEVQQGYDVCLQDEGFSCGMACVAMIVYIKTASKMTESAARQLSVSCGGSAYKPSVADKAKHMGGVAVLTMVSQPKAQVNLGTGMENLSQILKSVQINNTCSHYNDVANAVASQQWDNPMILHLQWGPNGGGGGHFVVGQYNVGAQMLAIRDPGNGVCGWNRSSGANYTDTKANTGRFSGWIIMTV